VHPLQIVVTRVRIVAAWRPSVVRTAPATACPVGVLLALALGAGCAAAAPMTGLERQRLVAHLEMTGSWLVDEVSGLSPAQLQFRPAPGTWNIMEVVEHLLVADPIYWQDLQKSLKAPPSGQARTGTDADILWYGIDRTQRQKAIPSEGPKGQLRDLGQGLERFRALHAQMLQYARTTNDDLRGHFVEREGCDAYQWLLLISTHEQRHILQIRELKADPKFPKK
jgi:DinB superfamily